MYDSKRVGIEYFPEGSKREDHVMWLNLLKKIPLENHFRKRWQNTECMQQAFPEGNKIL